MSDLLYDAVEKAARDLPGNYTVEINIENGSAWVNLIEGAWHSRAVEPMDDTLAEQIVRAVEMAKSIEKAKHE